MKTLSSDELFSRLENILINVLPPYIRVHILNRVPCDEVFMVNETGLLQVILNLTINARDAIGARRGYVEIILELISVNEGPNNRYILQDENISKVVLFPRSGFMEKLLKISVKDDGPGIPSEIIDKIFDPYFTTKTDGPVIGTGLGLSIVYSILESMGAGLEVTTDGKSGTIFSIYIPVSEVEEKKRPECPLYPVQGNLSIQNRNVNKRILLVDDEYDMRLISKKLLEKRGYDVILASNGEEALKILEDDSDLGLIIVDFHMPGIEGKELISRLSSKKNIPVIVMSGDVLEEIESMKKGGSILGVVKKPLEIEAFIDTVKKAIG